jgi:DNA-binding transcriptional regulator PaaX
MTEAEMNEMLKAIDEVFTEVLKSKEASWKFLIDAGIETEESRKKHEEKESKKKKNDLSSTLSDRRIP